MDDVNPAERFQRYLAAHPLEPRPRRRSRRAIVGGLVQALILYGALAAFVCGALYVRGAFAQDGTIRGRASVVDGDTVEIADRRVRFFGIDAPEIGQNCRDEAGRAFACGAEAANALDRRIAGRPLACAPQDVDRYDRIVAICRAGDEDLNGWMVAEGFALAYRRYSSAYIAAEEAARGRRVGLWRGSFEPPETFRHRPR